MRALSVKADAIARDAQQRRIAEVAHQWRELLPEASVSTSASEVIISARGLVKRWVADSALRFIGSHSR